MLVPTKPNERRSVDFMSDPLTDGRKRCVNGTLVVGSVIDLLSAPIAGYLSSSCCAAAERFSWIRIPRKSQALPTASTTTAMPAGIPTASTQVVSFVAPATITKDKNVVATTKHTKFSKRNFLTFAIFTGTPLHALSREFVRVDKIIQGFINFPGRFLDGVCCLVDGVGSSIDTHGPAGRETFSKDSKTYPTEPQSIYSPIG